MNDPLAALATKALDFVPEGARLGLGSGRTTSAFIQLLGERVQQGFRVRAVPTSQATAQLAQGLGIPLDLLAAGPPLDVTIDGADEVERGTLNLIKGWGGALVRERIVAAASLRQVILVTPEKLVDRLGERGRLPVEVLPFAAQFCRQSLAALSAYGEIRPEVRQHEGAPFVTDNGNWILDCSIGPIADPTGLQGVLKAIPGVVDTGLFLATASIVLVGQDDGVEEVVRR